MSKSVKRTRREAYNAEVPFYEQFEALWDDKLGNPSKANAVLGKIKAIKAANPKPGPADPDIVVVDRLSVLKVLQNNHGTAYTRAGGAITYEDIETEISSISNANDRRNAWLDYQEPYWTKEHSLVTLLSTEFGLDSGDIDGIFDAAVAHRLSKGLE